MEFEWDFFKEIENIQKHGVNFMEAIETFSDPDGFQLKDTKHSIVETRFFWVGKSRTGKVITTRFTQRGNIIRIIGAAAWRKFERLYNESTKTK
jgi:uncharacterized DUF497 family protein